MVREKDSVWAHWESLGINRDGRHYARCRNCLHRLQVNVSRFKLHLVLHCLNLDSSIREQYRPFVASNSLSTPKQKLALSYPITADSGEHCSKSPRGPVFSNSKSPSTSSMPQDLSREQSPNLIEDDDNTDVDNSVYSVKLERSAPTSHGSCKPPPTKKALLTRYRIGLPVHLDQVSADQKEGIHKTRAKVCYLSFVMNLWYEVLLYANVLYFSRWSFAPLCTQYCGISRSLKKYSIYYMSSDQLCWFIFVMHDFIQYINTQKSLLISNIMGSAGLHPRAVVPTLWGSGA